MQSYSKFRAFKINQDFRDINETKTLYILQINSVFLLHVSNSPIIFFNRSYQVTLFSPCILLPFQLPFDLELNFFFFFWLNELELLVGLIYRCEDFLRGIKKEMPHQLEQMKRLRFSSFFFEKLLFSFRNKMWKLWAFYFQKKSIADITLSSSFQNQPLKTEVILLRHRIPFKTVRLSVYRVFPREQKVYCSAQITGFKEKGGKS